MADHSDRGAGVSPAAGGSGTEPLFEITVVGINDAIKTLECLYQIPIRLSCEEKTSIIRVC